MSIKCVNTLLIQCFCFCLCSCNFHPEGTETQKYDFQPIHQTVQAWVDSGYYNGAGLMIARNNQVILDTCYGNYTPEAQVYIASAGKWLAAAAIAAVVDEGKLSWDDQVTKWLPEFTDVKGTATLRQLFSHTAGYPDYQPQGVKKDDYQTLEESVAHIVDLPADTVPGAEFHYGGLAMQVAGRMAELATGKDWETLFQEKIAQPLGMKNTHFTPVDSVDGHSPMLGGGARSTLHDYTAFLDMIFNNGVFRGKRILSEKAITEMQADQLRGAKIITPDYVRKVRAEQHKGVYGLGEWREEVDSLDNAVLISSPSWAGAYPWIDKTTDTYGFFITHVNVEKANQAGFSSFYSSPVLPILVRDVYKEAALPDSVERGVVPVENGTIYYQEAGSGEPLIFIHGHSFDHSEWEPQFPVFAKHFRTIVYDCRGYGRSSMPDENQPFRHVDDLITLMDSLHLEKAHLVGLSMGGFIVTDMLALHQDRILTATAASGDIFPVPGPSEPWTAEGIARRRDEIAALKANGILQQKWDWLAGLMSKGGSNLENIRRPVWDMIYRWSQWQPLHIEPRLVLGNDAVAILKSEKIDVPVMVLTGEVDYKGPRKLNECIPSAIQKIVPDAGHVSNLENPKAFNQLVMDFINENKSN
ncbi:alpha/beta fold hydrolase [Mangrovibacterium marinum]|uniref:CubicO group peptidase (Beta-lactamase class C family) n=1 Tax=Mangrovibacterium marinum TaxID=1639118 RepID=A0A2T5C5E3_9BACT|nr:alpha/beta fold hydrolase [Mangrovibacterium marinum]PTN10119.1 CubicO group peptidase (beta-lactamase class C family) [Mangrovibacterium marinum]